MPASGNVGIAFALVICAGLSTTLGACAAFFAKLAAPKYLAMGLSVSAGVMLYVSFVEIFMKKGVPALSKTSWGENKGYQYGTLLFFGGMIIIAILDLIVHLFSDMAGMNKKKEAANVTEMPHASNAEEDSKDISKVDPGELEAGPRSEGPPPSEGPPASDVSSESQPNEIQPIDHDAPVHLAHRPADMPKEAADTIDLYLSNDHHRFGLQRMGLMTALAIAIHNFPEGLATFVAALADPVNGLAIAFAIALHNIPEGVCVAMPVYYATGSRWKAFFWAFASGISEPIGGLIGYLLLYGSRMSSMAYGVLFCLVAGMMTFISVKELIPTALKYDPHNRVTSSGIVVGMVIISASLLLFTI